MNRFICFRTKKLPLQIRNDGTIRGIARHTKCIDVDSAFQVMSEAEDKIWSKRSGFGRSKDRCIQSEINLVLIKNIRAGYVQNRLLCKGSGAQNDSA